MFKKNIVLIFIFAIHVINISAADVAKNAIEGGLGTGLSMVGKSLAKYATSDLAKKGYMAAGALFLANQASKRVLPGVLNFRRSITDEAVASLVIFAKTLTELSNISLKEKIETLLTELHSYIAERYDQLTNFGFEEVNISNPKKYALGELMKKINTMITKIKGLTTIADDILLDLHSVGLSGVTPLVYLVIDINNKTEVGILESALKKLHTNLKLNNDKALQLKEKNKGTPQGGNAAPKSHQSDL